MVFDEKMLVKFYDEYIYKVDDAQEVLGRPMTLAEKILYSHLHEDSPLKDYKRGKDYVYFKPDRVAMQDATAQMALLQFMMAGKKRAAVPSTVHCDHLIQAHAGAKYDLKNALDKNSEVYKFLQTVSQKYGVGFWKPGAGIIHQIILENYAFPGGMMIGTDSHTVNAGGLGMVAVGVGGADAVDVMAGMPWELKMPRLIGVKLTGKLKGWTSSKDIILKIAGMLTAKGGTGAIIEYFGAGAKMLSTTAKATICNMGAEIGATTSLFGYSSSMARYLRWTRREKVARMCDVNKFWMTGDPEVYKEPEKYFDEVIHIHLPKLDPYINGPFSPDRAWMISRFATAIKRHDFPSKLSAGLIGSCTNSSYEDLTRAASVARQAAEKKLKVKADFIITPGSELIRETIERDGVLDDFKKIGGLVLANACGPCIGQWDREGADKQEKNSIITSFNRNFAKRNDGNPNTHAFVASPEMVTAMAIAGDLSFNPLKDYLINEDGERVKLDPPHGYELPDDGYAEVIDTGYVAPAKDGSNIRIRVKSTSERLQLLTPFKPITVAQLEGMRVLIKAKGKCTTDHISMAGPWLKYRGHLENISYNCYIGAVNYFNDETNKVLNVEAGKYMGVPDSAKYYKERGIGTVIFGEENLGEGSSREHAAMEPRFLGVKAVIVKSFARIHETNLKKQGMLALTFVDPDDYDKVRQDDKVDILGFDSFAPGKNLMVVLNHADGTKDEFEVTHTYSAGQVEWVRFGSALNKIRSESKKEEEEA